MSTSSTVRLAWKLAASEKGTVVRLRRELHRYPEIGREEVRTSRFVAETLGRAGIEVCRPRNSTGVIGRLMPEDSAARKAPAIALRADMDALPADEKTGLPFRSRIAGRAHLCGHDAHSAMLLAAAQALSRERRRLSRPVVFIFQPAEEQVPGGARTMIEAGAMEGVGEVYGLHVSPDRPVGVLVNASGVMMAAMDRFEMTILGRGGHGGMPQNTRDPVVAAAAVVIALQTVVSRRVSPTDACVVSVCTIDAPGTFNVIPDQVRLTGTCRSLSSHVHAALPALVREIAAGVARSHGCRLRLRYTRGTPVLANAPAAVAKVRALWAALTRGAEGGVADAAPIMGSEDFAFYLERVPGAFSFLGAGPGRGSGAPLHSPRFTLNERALPLGVALHIALALAPARRLTLEHT